MSLTWTWWPRDTALGRQGRWSGRDKALRCDLGVLRVPRVWVPGLTSPRQGRAFVASEASLVGSHGLFFVEAVSPPPTNAHYSTRSHDVTKLPFLAAGRAGSELPEQ